MSLGTKIKSFRVEKGKTPAQIAGHLGISESTYRRIENDKSEPDMSMLEKLSDVFEKPLVSFLSDKSLQTNYGQQGGIAQQINLLSEKLIEQYELRLKEKDETIAMLREMLEAKK